MSVPSRGAARTRQADGTAAGYVRTLDVYPVDVAGKHHTPPPHYAATHTTGAAGTRALADPPRSTPQRPQHFASIERSPLPSRVNAASGPSNPSPSAAAAAAAATAGRVGPRTVTEEDYRLGSHEIQQRVQQVLAAQVRTLLETRLQQRLQQARAAEAEMAAAARRAAAAASSLPVFPAAAAAAEAPASPDYSSAVPLPAGGHSEGADGESDGRGGGAGPSRPVEDGGASLTTTRLLHTAATAPAKPSIPAETEASRFAETLDAHPYSAVELVRVHRLRGIPDHNRGLFAAMAGRSFTTRSGHLVVNPDLDGKARVRSAVSGHVWMAQRKQQHQQQEAAVGGQQGPSPPGAQQHQQQQHETHLPHSLHLDAMVLNVGSSNTSQLRPGSASRPAPPRLVMKVVGDGAQASFKWTEDDSYHSGSAASAVQPATMQSLSSIDTPLSATLLEVLDRKYGKGLTGPERKEAERRLRARRYRQQQQGLAQGIDTAAAPADGTGKGKRTGRSKKAKEAAPSSSRAAPQRSATGPASSPSDAAAAAAAMASISAGAGGSNGASSEAAAAVASKKPSYVQGLLPVVLDKEAGAGGAQHGAAAEVSRSSSRFPPEFVSGAEAPDNSLDASHQPQADRSRGSRVGLSVSELERTMSVNEAEGRQRERQTRAEQADGDEAVPDGTQVKRTPARAGRAAAGVPPSTGAQLGGKPSRRGDASGLPGSGVRSPPSESGRLHTPSQPDFFAATAAGSMVGGSGQFSGPPSHTGSQTFGAQSGLGASGSAARSGRGAAVAGGSPGPSLSSSTHRSGQQTSAADDGGAGKGLAGGITPASRSEPRRQYGGYAGASGVGGGGGARSGRTERPKDDGEHKQIEAFLDHFPEAESHAQLRREAKNILDELEDLWDEDGPIAEHPFPLPQFASLEFNTLGSNAANNHNDGDAADGPRRAQRRPSQGGQGPTTPQDAPEEPMVGFEVDMEALQAKFYQEAAEECAELIARRDALLAQVTAQRQLIRDFGEDVHFLSVGSAHNDLSAEQYAIELTRDVNAYARQNHLLFNRGMEDDIFSSSASKSEVEEEARATMGFLARFGLEREPTRDVGTQVSDADVSYVDAAVRSTEARLESLFHHEKALLSAVRLATVAMANILSFHASLEMESTCHECFYVFDKPRTLWPCGHTFCHACLSTMYNARGDLICTECGSACEVGFTPNLAMELIANYQTVYTQAEDSAKTTGTSAFAGEKDAQTIEGVLRSLLNDLLVTQHSWSTAQPTIDSLFQ